MAGAVAADAADAGLGIRAAARALGLGFVPLAHERYELALRTESAQQPAVRAVLAALREPTFIAAVEALDGYDTRERGARAGGMSRVVDGETTHARID